MDDQHKTALHHKHHHHYNQHSVMQCVGMVQPPGGRHQPFALRNCNYTPWWRYVLMAHNRTKVKSTQLLSHWHDQHKTALHHKHHHHHNQHSVMQCVGMVQPPGGRHQPFALQNCNYTQLWRYVLTAHSRTKVKSTQLFLHWHPILITLPHKLWQIDTIWCRF